MRNARRIGCCGRTRSSRGAGIGVGRSLAVSPKGRPEGELAPKRVAEGSPMSPKGRPEGERRSAKHDSPPVSAR
jgi:hypothetical protein